MQKILLHNGQAAIFPYGRLNILFKAFLILQSKQTNNNTETNNISKKILNAKFQYQVDYSRLPSYEKCIHYCTSFHVLNSLIH